MNFKNDAKMHSAFFRPCRKERVVQVAGPGWYVYLGFLDIFLANGMVSFCSSFLFLPFLSSVCIKAE